jgi:hypothetical protein
MLRFLSRLFALCALATGCASHLPEQREAGSPPLPVAGAGEIQIYETPCYFTCPSYRISVTPDGAYALNNEKNTRRDGASQGRFEPSVWARAQAAFEAAKFDGLPNRLDRSTLPSEIYCINDLPDIHFTRIAADGAKKNVIWMTGCPLPEMQKLRDALRALFRYDALVKPD